MTVSGSTMTPLSSTGTRRTSLFRTFLIYTFGLFSVLGLIFVGALTKITWDTHYSRAVHAAETFFKATKQPFERAVWTVNEDATLQLIRGLESLDVVERVWVETPDTGNFGDPIADVGRNDALTYTLMSPSKQLQKDAIGQVFILIDRNAISFEILSTVALIVSIISLYILLLAIVIRSVFSRLIGEPLAKIVSYLSTPNLIENPPKEHLFPDRPDEIGILAGSLEQMVHRRHLDLQKIKDYQSNLEGLVSERTEQLKFVQEELIQADNLAALGALVAGVSHELNTPLGNALMAATTILDASNRIQHELDQATLSKDILEAEVQRISGTATIIVKTMGRARELVENFRQVAVDRQSERMRPFDFDHIVRETLTTLQPTLKKTGFKIKLDLNANTTINSYPGAISQLVSNLLENAIKHGYEDKDGGTIELSSCVKTEATSQRAEGSNKIIFRCKDFGVGIPEKNLKKVFEPFFTTKFGKGGSGLGMAICYQLVTDVLGGTVSVLSNVGSGTEIIIEIPAISPGVRAGPSAEKVR